MIIHPAFRSVFKRAHPKCTLLDLRSDTTNATSYTFSNLHLSIGSEPTGFSDGVWQENVGGGSGSLGDQRTSFHSNSSRSVIIAVIHTEDSATAFTASSCTLGGVAGQELYDRGGTVVAISTNLYYWDTASIANIANTDLVFTPSEQLACCVVGLLRVSNVGPPYFLSNNDAGTGTGTLNLSVGQNQNQMGQKGAWAIVASTLQTDSSTEGFQWTLWNAFGGGGQSYNSAGITELMYDGANAEMGYACLFQYLPQYIYEDAGSLGAAILMSDVSWSGAGQADAIIVGFPS